MPLNGDDISVLVVEDMPQAIKLLKMMLADLGVNQIYTARDGREAQEFLDDAADYIDMIICDWRMPRMTGLELLQQVRTVYPDMPFMMVTANADVDSVRAAGQFGVNAYIIKPFSAEQFERKFLALALQL
jgi:CheY-like chemotaxis protein